MEIELEGIKPKNKDSLLEYCTASVFHFRSNLGFRRKRLRNY